jgi:hypothetical protein
VPDSVGQAVNASQIKLQLSPSLSSLVEAHSEPVTGAWLVQEILRTHDYANGRAADLVRSSVAWPGGLRKEPIDLWYREGMTVLREDLAELNGKLLCVALAACDRRLGRPMVESGLFSCVLQDIEERFEIFSAQGKSCLELMPRSLIGSQIEPILLFRQGCFGRRGALSPDGTRAVGYDEHGLGEIALWNVESGQLMGRLKPPGQSVSAADGPGLRMVRFTKDGQGLRALLRDGGIVQWSLPDGVSRWLSNPIQGYVSGAVSLDGTTACVRLRRAALVIIDIDSGAQLEVPTGRPLTRICISADGQRIAGAAGRSIVVYDRTDGTFQETRYELRQEIHALECTTDTLVGAAGRRYFRRDHAQPEPGPAAERVGIVPDGSLAACVAPSGESVGMLQPGTAVTLGELPVVPDAIRSTFSLNGRRLLTTHGDESMRVWDVGLQPSSSRLPPAAFDSDSANDGRDLLDRSRDVDAFASLIAARSVQPPLSIGIFADWGGGKSWFMQQLRRRVAALAADARASGVRQAEVSSYKHIAQVQFNAWHYSETDVMASRTLLSLGSEVLSYALHPAR